GFIAVCSAVVCCVRLTTMNVSAFRNPTVPRSPHSENLHNLIAELVNHLYRNTTGPGFGERIRDVAVESLPCLLVYLRTERALQRLVGIRGTKEVRVSHEKAFFVVIGVDKPASDPFRTVARSEEHTSEPQSREK